MGFLGALTASLAALVAGRRATQDTVATTRSHCACGRSLRLYEVVPVVGYLLSKGTTPCCNTRIPLRWPLEEAALAIVSVLLFVLAPIAFTAVMLVSLTGVCLIEHKCSRLAGIDYTPAPIIVKETPPHDRRV